MNDCQSDEQEQEDSEFTLSDLYPFMDEVAAKSGWDDPEMDIYNDMAPKNDR